MTRISRNSPCPCGSGQKFKRCCLEAIDTAARVHHDHDRLGSDMLDWAHATHGDALEGLVKRSSAVSPWRLRDADLQLRLTWAMSEGVPDDGGSPLATRYALRADISESDREIAARISGARLDLYRIRNVVPGGWVEIEQLDGSRAPLRVVSASVSATVEVGALLLVRVMDADGLATFWGPACQYPAADERKWRAFLAVHDLETAVGSLRALEFIPADCAEPIAEDRHRHLHLHTAEWQIRDDDLVADELSESPRLVELGSEICDTADVWAYAWLSAPRTGIADLGGWPEDPAKVEVARLLLHPDRLCGLSTSPAVLSEIAMWVKANLEGLASQDLSRAV